MSKTTTFSILKNQNTEDLLGSANQWNYFVTIVKSFSLITITINKA